MLTFKWSMTLVHLKEFLLLFPPSYLFLCLLETSAPSRLGSVSYHSCTHNLFMLSMTSLLGFTVFGPSCSAQHGYPLSRKPVQAQPLPSWQRTANQSPCLWALPPTHPHQQPVWSSSQVKCCPPSLKPIHSLWRVWFVVQTSELGTKNIIKPKPVFLALSYSTILHILIPLLWNSRPVEFLTFHYRQLLKFVLFITLHLYTSSLPFLDSTSPRKAAYPLCPGG